MFKKVILPFNIIKNKLGDIIRGKNNLCRIEEIDLTENKIIISCRWIKSPIKLRLDEVINDPDVLANLSPKQASWVGFYYGKYYNKQQNHKFAVLEFNNQTNKCEIKCVTRDGYLIFSDNDENQLNRMQPINIMLDQNLISKFDSVQACYIGILSGIKKTKKYTRTMHKNFSLKLIKQDP